DDALVEFIMSDELRAGLYAFDLTNRRAKRPSGAPDASLARPVRKVGVIGAGLMASQLALLLARSLGVGVVMRDLDAERAQAGLDAVREQVEALRASGKVDDAGAHALTERVRA